MFRCLSLLRRFFLWNSCISLVWTSQWCCSHKHRWEQSQSNLSERFNSWYVAHYRDGRLLFIVKWWCCTVAFPFSGGKAWRFLSLENEEILLESRIDPAWWSLLSWRYCCATNSANRTNGISRFELARENASVAILAGRYELSQAQRKRSMLTDGQRF